MHHLKADRFVYSTPIIRPIPRKRSYRIAKKNKKPKQHEQFTGRKKIIWIGV